MRCWWSMSRTTSVPAGRWRFHVATRWCRWSIVWPNASRMWCSRRTGIRRGTNPSRPRIPGAGHTRQSTSPMGSRSCGRTTACRERRAPNCARSYKFPMRNLCCARAFTARSIPTRHSTRTTAERGPASPDTFSSAACGAVLAGLRLRLLRPLLRETRIRQRFVVIGDAVAASMSAARWRQRHSPGAPASAACRAPLSLDRCSVPRSRRPRDKRPRHLPPSLAPRGEILLPETNNTLGSMTTRGDFIGGMTGAMAWRCLVG